MCRRCPPAPCVAAAHTVPSQIPKCWLPRYIRRSRIQRPRRPLSLRFNGKLRLKGLKSGIKAAVARLLAPGRHMSGAGGGLEPRPRARQCCQGCARMDPPQRVCSCVWVSLGVSVHMLVCAGVHVFAGACARVCGCACVCTRVHKWLWCRYMRVHMCIFGGAHLYACAPVLWGAHLEKTQGSWSSGVSSPGLCPWGLGSTGGSSPSRSSRFSPGTGQRLACAAPQHLLIPAGCALSSAAAAPVSPGRSTPRVQGQVWGHSSRTGAPTWPCGAWSRCLEVI